MSALWIVQDNQLTTSELPAPIQDTISPPFPAGIWYESEDNTLITRVLPELVEGPLSSPYPAGIWYKNENNELDTRSLPDEIKMGAFLGCTKLRTATIAPSVKYIGEFAFAHFRTYYKATVIKTMLQQNKDISRLKCN